MDIYDELVAERRYQDEKWGGTKHDDSENTEASWVTYIREYLEGTSPRTLDRPLRLRMVKVAALAMASLEWWERKHNRLPSQGKIFHYASNLTVAIHLDETVTRQRIAETLTSGRMFQERMSLVLAQAINLIYVLDTRKPV